MLTCVNRLHSKKIGYGAMAMGETLKTNTTLTTLYFIVSERYVKCSLSIFVFFMHILRCLVRLLTCEHNYHSLGGDEIGGMAIGNALKTNPTLTTLK